MFAGNSLAWKYSNVRKLSRIQSSCWSSQVRQRDGCVVLADGRGGSVCRVFREVKVITADRQGNHSIDRTNRAKQFKQSSVGWCSIYVYLWLSFSLRWIATPQIMQMLGPGDSCYSFLWHLSEPNVFLQRLYQVNHWMEFKNVGLVDEVRLFRDSSWIYQVLVGATRSKTRIYIINMQCWGRFLTHDLTWKCDWEMVQRWVDVKPRHYVLLQARFDPTCSYSPSGRGVRLKDKSHNQLDLYGQQLLSLADRTSKIGQSHCTNWKERIAIIRYDY